MSSLLLDHSLKANFLKQIFYFHECPFCPTVTKLVKHFSPSVIVTMAPKGAASRETIEEVLGK